MVGVVDRFGPASAERRSLACALLSVSSLTFFTGEVEEETEIHRGRTSPETQTGPFAVLADE